LDLLRKTRAIVNLDHIQHNLLALRSTMDPQVKVAAVVKANAYGHDIVVTTGLLLESGVDYIAVATLQEAVQLRKHYPQANILVMGYTPDDQLDYAVDYQITQAVFSLAQCRILSRRAAATGKTARVHVKVDTGFNRLGYTDHDLALEEIAAMAQLPNLEVEGIFSHLALNSPESDEDQYQQLLALTEKLEGRGVTIPIKHICDSIGAVAYPQYHMDMVRLGALLYGYCSRKTEFELRPAMTLRTEVAMVKTIGPGQGVSYSHLFVTKADTRIATLPVGYADGIPRNIWKDGHVMIKGQAARYAGLPCMDQCMVDVTGLDVEVGDEVILFGGEGDNELHLTNLSQWCGTNRNELLARILPRVPRVFIRNGRIEKVVDYSGE
jgi:alanine racemase